MRHDHRYISWLVRCGSEEQARDIRQGFEAFPITSLTFSDTVRAFPSGSEIHQSQPHLVGDYFTSVAILPETEHSTFQLLFQRKPDAPRHWKDVMMYVLRMVREGGVRREAGSVQIILKYRGDAWPPNQSVG
jgi:hypothetical protein